MSEFNLKDKFPDLRPIQSAPSLGSVNGFGTTLVGHRDQDEETGTYVATYCLCALFIPVVALSAYRVLDSGDGGWYFLGKVPVSRFAKTWNLLLLLLLVGGAGLLGWHSYTSSPDYQAGRSLAEADRLAERGEQQAAARRYRDLMNGKTSSSSEARARLQALIESPPENLTEAAGVFAVALEMHRQNKTLLPDPQKKGSGAVLFERAMQHAGKHEKEDPEGALAVLDTVAPLAPRPVELLAIRRPFLEHVVAKKPDDPALASRLGAICKEMGDPKRALAVLQPYEDRLGDLDGAVILAQLYAAQGKYHKAEKLLRVYLDARLPKLRQADQNLRNAIEASERRARTLLKQGSAPNFDYEKANRLGQDERDAMAGDYLNAWVRDDPTVRDALKDRQAQASVVPAALELGMVRLQLAQGQETPDQRRKELESAEQAFLSVRGQAEKTPLYRLNLGQVYYWLGKHAEGKKLFDELLKDQKRAFDFLLAVSRALREVGSISEARALAEEAYKSSNDKERKYTAALMRSVMFIDLDDKIAWLQKCNADNLEVKAQLAYARGNKARQANKDDEAIRLYTEALALYTRMPEVAATFNNSALVHFELYYLNQDKEQLLHGLDKLDRAIALQPSNTILLLNAAASSMQSAAQDLIGSVIDLKILKQGADLSLLAYLYRDQAEKDKLMAKLIKHPGYLKSRGYYEKLMVLAPRNPTSYGQLAEIYTYSHDLEHLSNVWQKLEGVAIDREQYDRERRDFYAGREDEKKLADLKKSVTRQEAILTEARKKKGTTFAVAANHLASQQLSGAMMGLPVDADALVRLAEEANEAAPSAATQTVLIQALCWRAHQTLIRQEPDYAKLARKTQRSLGSSLLMWVTARGGELRDKVVENADVKRAVPLQLAQAKAFPDQQEPVTWAFLRASRPKEAEEIARKILADKQEAIKRKIERLLSPLNASVALDEHWVLLMAGKDTEADAVLADAAKRGVPMLAK